MISSMTLDQFLEELARLSDRYRWVLIPDQGRYSERRSQPRLHLRAKTEGTLGRGLSPLAAVCHGRGWPLQNPESWIEAAGLLGLSQKDAQRVSAAANDATWKGETGARAPDPGLEDLRARMIDAVGLSPPEPE